LGNIVVSKADIFWDNLIHRVQPGWIHLDVFADLHLNLIMPATNLLLAPFAVVQNWFLFPLFIL
jgi:hypothetical protein